MSFYVTAKCCEQAAEDNRLSCHPVLPAVNGEHPVRWMLHMQVKSPPAKFCPWCGTPTELLDKETGEPVVPS